MLKWLIPLFLTCAAAFSAEEYELHMDRPSRPGERSSITGNCQSKQVMQVKVDGKVAKNDRLEIDVEFDVEREVLAVNGAGKSTHDRVKVLKIVGTFNGMPVTQLKSGDIVESKVEAVGNAVLVNGQRATAEQAQLTRALPKSAGRSLVREDDAYGPGRKIKVGDEWPINAAAAVKQAADSGVPGLTPDGIKGTVKLLEVTNRDGQPCLKVRGKMEMSGSGMSVPNAPPEVKVTELTGGMTIESEFPVDHTAIVPWSDFEMKMRMAATGDVEKNGRKLRIESNMEFANRSRAQVKRLE
jgi:hypothetical protein